MTHSQARSATTTLSPPSLERFRLLAGAALAAGGAEAAELVQLWIATLHEPVDARVCTWARADDATVPPLDPPPAPVSGSLALVPLRDADGPLTATPDEGGLPLALCVVRPQPHPWPPGAERALLAIADAVVAELRTLHRLAVLEAETRELRERPLHDPLTDAAVRELFFDRVEQALLRHVRAPNRGLAVVSVAIHQLEDIEHTFGYDTAQEVLREVALRLQSVLRNVDSIGRVSHHEFGVLLESLRENSDAARVATRIHESLRSAIVTTWHQFIVSAHVGVVLCERGVDSPARLVQLATLARERSRFNGTPFEIFDPAMQQTAELRLRRETDLRRAFEAKEFELHYQPIVSLATGRIAKLEGLVRWKHRTRGLVTASEFIGLAEETGLVIPLGWTVLAQGCAQLHRWRSQSQAPEALTLSMNITAGHLRHRELMSRLDGILAEWQLPANAIDLEITEGVLIGDADKARDVLTQLRARGVGIHLDDFGSGYSSLRYLHELPIDAIKIDREFIARMAGGPHYVRLVSMIRELARQIGVPVVAEGVETDAQLDRVRELGCEFAQGYLFSRPLAPPEMTELLARDPVWH